MTRRNNLDLAPRNVNQKYVLQPNLNVSRPALATYAPGLSGLLLPGMAPIATQYPKQQQQELVAPRHQAPARQRFSTPSSPSLRGRQSQANPNFAPPASNISTRLPTPVRINASPGPSPSPTSVAPMLPKPPSPSRSLSQGGAPVTNPFACASAYSSPPATFAATNAFMLPTPPSILSNGPPTRVTPIQQAAARSTPSPMPWASSAAQGQNNLTPTSVRPSPPPPERSILASVQLLNQSQQQRSTGYGSAVVGTSSLSAAIPGHSEWLAPVAAPAPSSVITGVAPVLTAPAIQAALQQALQGAMERKPEAFRVDDFERFFDSMMHPGDTGKLDGPLPHELADDIRYSDNWYKHCRDWNAHNKLTTPYSAPAPSGTAPEMSTFCRLDDTPFAGEQYTCTAPAATQQEPEAHGQPQWRLGESSMSEACCKALDIAHHGLCKVVTPTARSRSATDMSGMAGCASTGQGTSAPASLLDQHQQSLTRRRATAAVAPGELWDTGPSHAQQGAYTAAALTSGLETLARDQIATVATSAAAADGPVNSQRHLAPSLSLVASTAENPLTAAVHGEDSGAAASGVSVDVSATPIRTSINLPGGRKFLVPALRLGSLDVLPRAAGAALSPPPDSARPPSTAATTPGPRTPGEGGGGAPNSTVTTAANTPVGRDATGGAVTPTTTTSRVNVEASPFFEAASQDLEVAVAPPPSKLSRDVAATDYVRDVAVVGSVELQGALQIQTLSTAEAPAPSASAANATADVTTLTETWLPAFPTAVSQQAVTKRAAAAAAGPQAFFNTGGASVPSAGPSSLAAAVTAVAVPGKAASAALKSTAGPSTSSASATADPLKEIVVGIEKLSTLKQNILAEDKEVDVASITQMIQLKLAVEQLLARTRSASKAQAAAVTATAAPAASSAKCILGASGANAAGQAIVTPASPSTTVVGVKASRPMSASALPRQAASPSLADKSRYAELHQRAAARLAAAAAEPASGTRQAQGASGQVQRGGIWQRYEEKIAMHRHQLDTTKAQLDEAVRKLNDMQAEFDELLLCLGMESAKNKALCDAMRAAGLDPEPILAAIEEQWMSGALA
ncbi:hypothetical protein VOLCADRAFT_95604 [Volvox carteri f. nagariensis]|uniref:Uncharacterized protein n=1 Tax=Volvox carteri f. nagariensis TaxID=3068 RepID=D8U822_VOLCA|nr:uncharacterized protein VOLCADRAFT_95604 [Volvox carteri f. nagariensis]EFJ44142.1 hypothetical protein VOLCADRAFT_95604 [Volvox carteri f. nagariensis]|eukprot:XP_002954736.1 hypothetical protein VOLCADRAFT_95604 [Volvox carteri f. nagariensis]